MSPKNNDEDKPPLHIAMYPWLALGHLNGFLFLADKLAEHGHNISFFLPTKTLTKFAPRNRHPTLITFIPVTIPHVDGLPEGAETTNDVTASARPALWVAMDQTMDFIDSHLAQLKPDIVFFDFAHWIPGVARKHGIKSVKYSVCFLIATAYYLGRRPEEFKDLTVAPGWFPCPEIRLSKHEARTSMGVAGGTGSGGGMSLATRLTISFQECDALAFRACREVEGPYIDYSSNALDKPLFIAGALISKPPPILSKLRVVDDDSFSGWLDGFDKASVVYCTLGTEPILTVDQLQELVLGLELTGRPFLATLKLPGCGTIESALPEGFLQRTKGRGIIHGGWVNQQAILQHPSVGCFVTQCGTNSMWEGIMSECQLVLIPQQVDQFITARLMSMDLKLAVEVDKRKDDGLFTREAVRKAIELVTEPENQVGKQVRANHTKLRQLLTTKGLEESYVTEFVKKLRDLL